MVVKRPSFGNDLNMSTDCNAAHDMQVSGQSDRIEHKSETKSTFCSEHLFRRELAPLACSYNFSDPANFLRRRTTLRACLPSVVEFFWTVGKNDVVRNI